MTTYAVAPRSLAHYIPHSPPIGTARILRSADFPMIMDFRSVVFAGLPNKDFIYPEDDDPAFIAAHLGTHGMSVGVFSGSELVAFTNLTLPTREMIGTPWLGVPGRRVGDHQALLMNGMVRPGFEGGGLHKYSIAERIRIAVTDGRTVVRALSSPYNHRSWGNFILHGFVAKGFIRPVEPKYGMLLRYILDLDLRQKLVGKEGTSILVEAADIQQQEACFAAGMIGVQRVMKAGVAYLELMVPQSPPLEH